MASKGEQGRTAADAVVDLLELNIADSWLCRNQHDLVVTLFWEDTGVWEAWDAETGEPLYHTQIGSMEQES